MRNHTVNMTLQVIPMGSGSKTYGIIDEAIKVIQTSGIRYQVCPFETVLEGDYDKLMNVLKKAQEVCFKYGAESILTHIKIEWHRDRDASIDEKVSKYKGKTKD